jgi:hypothetical protein
VTPTTGLTCFGTTSLTVTVTDNPDVTANNGTICEGGSINLNTLISDADGGTITFHESQADANSGANPIAQPVSPTANKTYYVRSAVTPTTGLTCFGTTSLTVTVADNPDKPSVCEVPLSLCPSGGATTITLKVGNLQANAYYQVTQGTSPNFSYNQTQQAPATVTAATVLTFNGLAPGAGFSVRGENRVSNSLSCFGPAAGCADLTTCGAPSTTTRSVAPTEEVQKIQTIDARISGAKTKVLAAPNPFTNKVRFTLQSDVSGQGSLEIYNTVGQKVATVYQGYVEAGQVLNKEYSVQKAARANLIYVFRVGDQKTTGKLLNW